MIDEVCTTSLAPSRTSLQRAADACGIEAHGVDTDTHTEKLKQISSRASPISVGQIYLSTEPCSAAWFIPLGGHHPGQSPSAQPSPLGAEGNWRHQVRELLKEERACVAPAVSRERLHVSAVSYASLMRNVIKFQRTRFAARSAASAAAAAAATAPASAHVNSAAENARVTAAAVRSPPDRFDNDDASTIGVKRKRYDDFYLLADPAPGGGIRVPQPRLWIRVSQPRWLSTRTICVDKRQIAPSVATIGSDERRARAHWARKQLYATHRATHSCTL